MSEKNIDLNDMTHMLDNWNPTPEELKEFTEKISKWAISKGGEYIKKSEPFDKTIRRNSIWNEVTNAEGKDLEEIVNDLPTYSIPNIEKIRAEINEEREFAYADFEQYKIEVLGVDPEMVEDELPHDDFRYGLERAIEIINEHIGE